jgi:hypothetical protein
MRAALLAALLLGCSAGEAPALDECREDRCAAVDSRDELLAAIDGFSDPVAAWLRSAATERGTLEGDYRAVLDGVGDELGCDAASESSFVVLSNADFTPKPILARCKGDAVAASRFLVAMVGDMSGMRSRQIHLAAWDDEAGAYRRYATAETATGEMAVNVQPTFCLGCHGGPERLDTWVPLMNEMTSPWSGWNAHPGFASQLFDEHLGAQYADDATYREVTRAGLLDSAAAFEPIVRAGVARVTGARLRRRAAGPDVARALELVRPLFCDEGLNYVSEVHDSGELRSHALVDDALRGLYRDLGVDGGWSWLRDTRIALPAPRGGEAPVTLIPVRGEATVAMELGLVARGVLDARDALRVRALDWQHPVQSELRCGLYRAAAPRIAAELEVGDAMTTAALIPRVVDEILAIGGRRLRPGAGLDLVALPDADDPAARAALESGDFRGLETTLADLGAAIEAHVAAASRPALARERDRRACRAVASSPTAPIYPELSCP